MTGYEVSPEHRRWVVWAFLVVLLDQSYFLGGYAGPEEWDSLAGRLVFLAGGLAIGFLVIEMGRYFFRSIAAWTVAKQLRFCPVVAVPVLAVQGLGLHIRL